MTPRYRQNKENRKESKKIRIPKTSVVFMKEKENGPPIAELLGIARTRINLKELNINQQPKIRRAAGGGTLIEISDEESKKKANKLCNKLREILADNAKILVPTKNITLRIAGFDLSVKKKDIEEAVILRSGCMVDEIEIGEIIRLRNGLYSVWIKCPIAGANKMTENRLIDIGWTSTQVEITQNNII